MFIALYDYDAVTMSPNKDSADTELSFHAGDFINVFGEADEDGFFIGKVSVLTVTGHWPASQLVIRSVACLSARQSTG